MTSEPVMASQWKLVYIYSAAW